jgi:hypothetical protein
MQNRLAVASSQEKKTKGTREAMTVDQNTDSTLLRSLISAINHMTASGSLRDHTRRGEMKDVLKRFIGKTLRIYTVSGVESYLGLLDEVKDDYLVLKSFFQEDTTYIALKHIESFKEETKR